MEDETISAKLTNRSNAGSVVCLVLFRLSGRKGDETAGVGAGPSVKTRFVDGCLIGVLLGDGSFCFGSFSAGSFVERLLPAAAQQDGC